MFPSLTSAGDSRHLDGNFQECRRGTGSFDPGRSCAETTTSFCLLPWGASTAETEPPAQPSAPLPSQLRQEESSGVMREEASAVRRRGALGSDSNPGNAQPRGFGQATHRPLSALLFSSECHTQSYLQSRTIGSGMELNNCTTYAAEQGFSASAPLLWGPGVSLRGGILGPIAASPPSPHQMPAAPPKWRGEGTTSPHV